MTISANPGLKVNLLFCFNSILSTGRSLFKLHKMKHLLIHIKVSENKIPTFLSGCSEFCSVIFH